MTTATQLAVANRAKSERWRRANKPSAAAKARRYAAKRFGEAVQCARLFCRNRTRHESGLCWRHQHPADRARTRLKAMSAKERAQTLVDAGIYTSSGNLTKRYGGK